jgi:hypothetical protein
MPRQSFVLISLVFCSLTTFATVHAEHPVDPETGRKSVTIRFTETAPDIDGFIEDVWEQADSAYDFIQFVPYEGAEPAERTAAYVLQDDENLYVAFRCYADSTKPIACLTADEDYIVVALDPFWSRSTAYFFFVYASGYIEDGWTLDNGAVNDGSWEGIWYRGVQIFDDRWEVEVKIPFKSIRYKKGLDRWGIEFVRYMACGKEMDFWNDYPQVEGPMVSRYGSLSGIDPRATGYYFELYPEGFLRYDKYMEGTDYDERVKPRMSLNLKWDITPQTTLNATAYPDFAQIESDPFELNLERYPVHFDERRPFFIEGMDIFRMSRFGPGFFEPLELFYSRRIGRTIDGDAVDILGGLKVTHKTEDWNLGALGAYTDEYVESDSVIEPRRGFGVLKAKRRIFENSDIGLLFSGTYANEEDYNYTLGFDGVYRKGYTQWILQGAVSERNEKRGWALNSGVFGMLGNFLTGATVEIIQDSFDVGDVGFVPWAGLKKFFAMSGPHWTFHKGALRTLYVAPGVYISQEPGDTNWSTVGYFYVEPDFRNDWGIDLQLYAGRLFEADTNYFYRRMQLEVHGQIRGNHLNFGNDYRYGFNYRRGFLAYQGASWIATGQTIIPELTVNLNAGMWVEWDESGSLLAITPQITPWIFVRFNSDMELKIMNEFVLTMPEARTSDAEWLSNRFSLYFSWRFKPKSWIYFAINDYRVQDANGDLTLLNRIGAIKVKYLIYF